jgi:adenine deaminase
MDATFSISGQYIDLFSRKIFPARINIVQGVIASIEPLEYAPDQYILPGFVDAHVHIESSMLVPSEFARLALIHGTVATISDPHEIANVCGKEGVEYMIDNSKQTALKIFFGAPSCVPATNFETAGAVLNAHDIDELLASKDIWYLAEMMNYPGVLTKDPEVMAKMAHAQKHGKPIDGHAPGVRGEAIQRYATAGITTDHESVSYEEALEKLQHGIKCLIREGSAAKNFDALIEIIRTHPDKIMFCSDDKHPDELVLHHINLHVQRALSKGYDLFDVLRAASVNPVLHYKIPVGLLRVGDPADFIVVNDLEEFQVLKNYINGRLVAAEGKCLLPSVNIPLLNHFHAALVTPDMFRVEAPKYHTRLQVMEAIDGQIVTGAGIYEILIQDGVVISDVANDVLKIAVINRYTSTPSPAVAFIRGFGLQKGAIASTVAHDCHNIIVVGVDDASMAAAVNHIIDAKGGISVAISPQEVHCLPLPVAGLMTHEDGHQTARQYSLLDKQAKKVLGSHLSAPFMTLSFMALLVIPSLKLSDKGLFDGRKFTFTDPLVS